MKILWFTNSILSDNLSCATGTWLQTMSRSLRDSGIELFNITQSISYSRITRIDYPGLKQWVLPCYTLHNGVPSDSNIKKIQSIVDEVNPDIIHIWGTEKYWGLLTARGYIKGTVILEIEGIMASCVDVFYGGLSFTEILQCFRLKEFLSFSRFIVGQKREFKKWGYYEIEMLQKHKYISTQSEWVREWIAPYVDVNTIILKTMISIRDPFLKSKQWQAHSHIAPTIFTMSSGASSYKGLTNVIKSIALLRRKYPDIQLRIAGEFLVNAAKWRKPGYTLFVERLIRKLNLNTNVIFCGPLNASELVTELTNADVFIQSSYVESYSVALAECMAVGTPAIVSFAGAMPELAENNVSAMFYSCSDYAKCAALISKLFEDKELSTIISCGSRRRSQRRNESNSIVLRQLEIYNKVLKK